MVTLAVVILEVLEMEGVVMVGVKSVNEGMLFAAIVAERLTLRFTAACEYYEANRKRKVERWNCNY
ncbi:hypothetical protein ACJJIX_13840 [Microbulbifer sp. VAAC004]|uniref:hypothetical protein n=1 Tax=unclassified Microbulbifer TaxID=2619833 RepID=UPI00403A1B31